NARWYPLPADIQIVVEEERRRRVGASAPYTAVWDYLAEQHAVAPTWTAVRDHHRRSAEPRACDHFGRHGADALSSVVRSREPSCDRQHIDKCGARHLRLLGCFARVAGGDASGAIQRKARRGDAEEVRIQLPL